MTIDNAGWHNIDEITGDLPFENSGTHIGFFLSWVIFNNLIGDIHKKESMDLLNKVKNKEITGRDFLFDVCDGKLRKEDLNKQGQEFAAWYYNEKSGDKYLMDITNVFQNYPTNYHAEDTWKNYKKIEKYINKAFQKWLDKKNGVNRKGLLFIIFVTLFFSVLAALANIAAGSKTIIPQIINVGLTATLSYFLYKENQWARWIFVILALLGGLLSIFVALELGVAPLLIGLFYIGASIYLGFIKNWRK